MERVSPDRLGVDSRVAAANAANTHHAVYFEASDWSLGRSNWSASQPGSLISLPLPRMLGGLLRATDCL
jgi:hypothetical protein